ncbi:uncharacterized [Lates japonicus]
MDLLRKYTTVDFKRSSTPDRTLVTYLDLTQHSTALFSYLERVCAAKAEMRTTRTPAGKFRYSDVLR